MVKIEIGISSIASLVLLRPSYIINQAIYSRGLASTAAHFGFTLGIARARGVFSCPVWCEARGHGAKEFGLSKVVPTAKLEMIRAGSSNLRGPTIVSTRLYKWMANPWRWNLGVVCLLLDRIKLLSS